MWYKFSVNIAIILKSIGGGANNVQNGDRINRTAERVYGQDPREIPIYTLSDASKYLKMSQVTLRSWVVGRSYRLGDGTSKWWPSVVQPAGADTRLLSFINLIELHVLSGIRRVHRVQFQKVRSALAFLEKTFSTTPNPLANVEFWTDQFDLFIEKSGDLICASRAGQQVIKEAVDQYLHRIDRDPDMQPLRLYPFSRELIVHPSQEKTVLQKLKNEPRSIAIDPLVAFGRPTISDTGVPTNVISGRFRAGEKITDLVEDYGIGKAEIEQALEYEGVIRRAA